MLVTSPNCHLPVRLIHWQPPGAQAVELWVATVDAKDGRHLVFAQFPKGEPEAARCADAGVLDGFGMELLEPSCLPIVAFHEYMKGGCSVSEHTLVLAWAATAREVVVASDTRTSNPREQCFDERERAENERASMAHFVAERAALKAGREARAKHRYADAERSFASVAKESFEARLEQARALLALGQYSKAELILLGVVGSSPAWTEPWGVLVDLYRTIKSPL